MTADFQPEEILRVLAAHDLEYVLIGGLAAFLQGSPLPTEDIDITPKAERANLTRLSEALRELDAKVRAGDEELPFQHDGRSLGDVNVWNLTTRYGALDVTFTPSGTTGYPDLRRDSVEVVIRGTPVRLASLADIVRSKGAANRDKDRRALPVLRELLAQQRAQRHAGEDLADMPSWSEVFHAAPEIARCAKERLDAHGHKILATLRRDGSPRLSGIETTFRDGELWLAGMPGSLKFVDLRRDPRLALHSTSDDPDSWRGDAKLSGTAVEVTDPAGLAAFAAASEGVAPGPFELFRVDVTELVVVRVGEPADHLVIESWRPGAGVRRTERR